MTNQLNIETHPLHSNLPSSVKSLEQSILSNISNEISSYTLRLQDQWNAKYVALNSNLERTRRELMEAKLKLTERERKYRELKEQSMQYRMMVNNWFKDYANSPHRSSHDVPKKRPRLEQRAAQGKAAASEKMDRIVVARAAVAAAKKDRVMDVWSGRRRRDSSSRSTSPIPEFVASTERSNSNAAVVPQEVENVEKEARCLTPLMSNVNRESNSLLKQSKVDEERKVPATAEVDRGKEDDTTLTQEDESYEDQRSNTRKITEDKNENQIEEKGKEEEDQSSIDYPYQEVVRKKSERRALPGHDCQACREFYDAICRQTKPGEEPMIDRCAFVQECSRHRSRFAPRSTPPGFWDLSFADSVAARGETDGE